MTNDVYTIGLTRTELQTLKVLLPITFPVIPYDTEQLDESEIKRITGQARCIVLNPKHLVAETLAEFIYDQDYLCNHGQPVPVILLSDHLTREQQHTVPVPEYLSVIDLHKRIDRNRSFAVKTLREASLPCWQNRVAMRSNMFNDGWYLIDIETTGVEVWEDSIICIRLAYMANYKIVGQPQTIYIRQSKPLPDGISRITGITDEMLAQGISLEEAVEQLEGLSCSNTPFVLTSEEFTAGFLKAAFLRCGKSFVRPYVAIDKLAAIPFGYLMQCHALNTPSLIDPGSSSNLFFDDQLQELYELTKCVFENLCIRYDVRCPGQFDKLYAAELCGV